MKLVYNSKGAVRDLRIENDGNVVLMDVDGINKLKTLLQDVGEIDDICCGDFGSQSVEVEF